MIDEAILIPESNSPIGPAIASSLRANFFHAHDS
jgi:hypothetical protein